MSNDQARLSANELKILQESLDLGRKIEDLSQRSGFKMGEVADDLQTLRERLFAFSNSTRPDLQKLVGIAKHLHSEMTLREFYNWLIPLERILDRSRQDDEFLSDFQDSLFRQRPLRPLYFILDNLRSAFNVGAIFRLADAVGASEIALCGYTATPQQAAVQKTAMSSDQYVPYRQFHTSTLAIEAYKAQGIRILALETTVQAIDLFQSPLQGSCALVLGNERFGLDSKVLAQTDGVIRLAMYGVKNSLNVGQAAAIVAYEWSRQNL